MNVPIIKRKEPMSATKVRVRFSKREMEYVDAFARFNELDVEETIRRLVLGYIKASIVPAETPETSKSNGEGGND